LATGARPTGCTKTPGPTAFNGHYGVAIYDDHVILNPDMSLTEQGRALVEVLQPLRNGVGTLLYSSRLSDPVVALPYDPGALRVEVRRSKITTACHVPVTASRAATKKGSGTCLVQEPFWYWAGEKGS